MSFPAYEEYKDSGVEWLGDVPEHWTIAKTAWYFGIAMGQTILREELEEGGEWPVYSATDGDHYFGRVNDPRVRLEAGDIVIPARGNSIGAVKIVKEPATTTQTTIYCKHRSGSQLLPGFVYQFLTGCKSNLFYFTQTAIPQITVEEVGSNPILIPPLPEQKTIAAFLDAETSKIDGLVSEQRRLIELLKEKRQAVISHAVTKGLNPDVKMKDSGIQWLGEVPEHWEVGSLKRFWSVTDCKHVTAEFVDDGGIPLASIREVQSKWVALDEAKRTTQEFYDLLIEGGREPQVGDLIFSRNATVGEVAQVGEHTPRFAMGQDVCLLRRLHDGSSPDYWQHVIKSIEVVEQMSVLMVGATFKRINVDEIRNLSVLAPPLKEQREIAEFLDVRVEWFDKLIAQAERAIELLQERRTALISAAVTGKIDVRGYVAEEVAA